MEQDQKNQVNIVDKSVSLEQTPRPPKTPITEESLVSEIPPTPKKKNRRKLFLSIGSVFLLFAAALGIVLWQQFQTPTKKKQAPSPTPSVTLSQGALQINEDDVAEGEGEIAYLQNGKIWTVSKDLTKKMEYKLAEDADTIIDFAFSYDGQQLYWLTEAGELWKMDKSGGINPLVTQASNMISATFEDPITKTVTTYQKGKVTAFHLSARGEYIAYETLETFIGCCMSPYDIPVNQIRIMKNDGTRKVKVQLPAPVYEHELLFFDGWFLDSKKIIFHFMAADAATQGSPFFEVGVNGRNPKRFTGIESLEFGGTVAGAVPVFSPDGEKMAYLEGGVVGEGKSWLSNVDGTDKKALITNEKYNFTDFSWSNDGSLLLVNSYDEFTIFNQRAEIVYQTSVDQTNKIEGIRSVISPDNKYVAISSTDRLLFINIKTGEKRELNIPTSNDQAQIYPQLITKSGRFYYLKDTDQETKGLYPQLWMIDTIALKNYKIADNTSLVEDVP